MKRFLILFPLLLIAGGVFFYWFNLQPVGTNTEKVFVINRGESSKSIAQRLEKQNLIKDKLVFLLFLKLTNQQGKLQAGSFKLSSDYTVEKTVDVLQTGKIDTWITFLEGWRREQYASLLKTKLNLEEKQFLQASKNKEGYLFPDSYLFPNEYSALDIVERLETTFSQKVSALDLSSSDLTLDQIVTIASLVEREANTASGREIVAGILIKRLNNDWPLQVDATVQYIKATQVCKGQLDCNWWPEVTRSDLKQLESPFNTYLTPGLPPSPICNPSFKSIKAVVNARITDYWYYLTGKDGQMYYAKTLEKHNQNINLYLRS